MSKFNIYCRKDGRLEGRIQLGKGDNGKRKYQAFFGHSCDEVIMKMKQYRLNQMNQSPLDITFAELFHNWFEKISFTVKESTSSNYWMKGEKHLLPFFGDMMLNTIQAKDVYAFIEEKKQQNLSNRYIADHLTLLKTVFCYAVKLYHIANPMDDVEFKRPKACEISILDERQQAKLKAYLKEHSDRTSMGIALCKATGLRIGELCAMRWKDIDLKKRVLTVRHTLQRIQAHNSTAKTKLILGEPKTETSKRVIPIPEFMVEILAKFQGKLNQFILSGTEKPIEPRVMQYRFARILKNAKLPSVHFHALRHMFASNCIQLGFDMKSLSEILGHSSIEITMNLYVHSSFEQKRKFMDRIAA